MIRRPLVIAGPTGSGKSELAIAIALAAGGEIVNFDSVQIYRGFDLGSAKPSREARAVVPHHLLDVVDADEEFNAADYASLARKACLDIAGRGRLPILAGGTFFYLRALLSGLPEMPARAEEVRTRIAAIARKPAGPSRLHRWLTRVDPLTAARVAPGDRHRVERALEVWIASGRPISSWKRPAGEDDEMPADKIALSVPREVLLPRLAARVERMYDDGLVEETGQLLARFPITARPFQTIGYKEAAAVVRGDMTRPGAIAETIRRTRAYAKRQMTWLRSERNVQWIDASDRESALAAALRLLEVE